MLTARRPDQIIAPVARYLATRPVGPAPDVGVFVRHPVGVNVRPPNVEGAAVAPNEAGETAVQPALDAWPSVYRSR
jgi:hypothetical protein